MTIAATYVTTEGVVFGADSLATVTHDGKVVQFLDHAQKIFEVGENSRIGFCYWGDMSLGGTSQRTLAARLSEREGFTAFTVEQAAQALKELVSEALNAAPPLRDQLGYFIGGWDLETHAPLSYYILFKPNQGPEVIPIPMGAMFAPHTQFFNRIVRGYDPSLHKELKAAFAKKFWEQPPPDFDTKFDEVFKEATKQLAFAGSPDLPIRDAIDYVNAYLQITIKASKFCHGPSVCGGNVEIAFITTDRCFRWARHNQFDVAIET